MRAKVGALAVILAAIGLAACGSGGSSTSTHASSAPPASTAGAAAAAAAAAAKPGTPHTAERLTGTQSQPLELKSDYYNDAAGGTIAPNPVDVKVSIVGLTKPITGFDTGKNSHVLGVKLHFDNVGREPFKDLQPHGTMTLADGSSAGATNLIAVGSKSPCDSTTVSLKPGMSGNSCSAFVVPNSTKPSVYQYQLSTGDTGVWHLN
jgi:hypothetical protein